jgi:NADH dehydrogenase [ubiquinone] 1 alpha subcomplex assembly factor 7
MALLATLKAMIAAEGPIGMDRYMSACLTDPVDGYYMTRDPLGRSGDFVTAPEISQIFGEMIGLWAAAVWQQMGSPASFRLVELGPGRGTLMMDALRALKTVPACLAAAAIDLVEISPILRQHQREVLARHHPERSVAWHASLDAVPADLPTIIIANEFFDALPVRQWVCRSGVWRERCVGWQNDSLSLVEVDKPDAPDRPAVEEGAIMETAAAARSMAQGIGQRLGDTVGVCLVIDYGHCDGGIGDSLQAISRHGYTPVLANPGGADLTAHVDFAALGEAFAAAGLALHGPTTQGRWLGELGAGTRAAQLMKGRDHAVTATISQGLRRLLDPMAMGSLFKVMAVSSDLGPLPGFRA